MSEYLAPGVFIEETSFRGKPIEGVSTSTAGFVGRARRGPVDTPTFVSSYAEFERTFGPPYPCTSVSEAAANGEFLGHAVKAFFENGGRRAWIVRVVGGVSTSATAPRLTAALATDVVPAVAQGFVYRFRSATLFNGAELLHLTTTRGLGMSDGGGTRAMKLWEVAADGSMTELDALEITSFDDATATITLGVPVALGAASHPTGTLLLTTEPLKPGTSGGNNPPTVTAVELGTSGDDISVVFRPEDGPLMPLVPPPAVAIESTPTVTLAISSGVASLDLTGVEVDDDSSVELHVFRRLHAGAKLLVNGTDAHTVATVGSVDFAADATGSATGTSWHAYDGDLDLGAVTFATPSTGPITFSASIDVATRLRDGVTLKSTSSGSLTLANLRLDDEVTFTCTPPLGGASATATVSLSRVIAVASNDTGFHGPFMSVSADAEAYVAVHPSSEAPSADNSHLVIDSYDYDGMRWLVFAETLPVGTHATPALAAASSVRLRPTQWRPQVGCVVEVADGLDKVAARVKTVTVETDGAVTVELLDISSSADGSTPSALRAGTSYLRSLFTTVEVQVAGRTVESFRGLQWTDATAPNYYQTRVNATSRVIQIAGGNEHPFPPTTTLGVPVALSNGVDAPAPGADKFLGTDGGPGARTGIHALRDIEDISIVAVPGVTNPVVQAALVSHAEQMKYRVAVLDNPPDAVSVSALQAHRFNYDSSHAAYYAPWLEGPGTGAATIALPPSGHMAGVWARNDATRGVWKAPANEVVRGITGLKVNYTTGDQEALNPDSVNLIRKFPTRGIRVWGARTATEDPEWHYLNIRRYFAFLEASIDRGTQWVVFEPNNEALWARVVSTIESFLIGQWRAGALVGARPEDAFFVRCDRTTMTQDDLDNGRLVCLIGVAPARPAEFVIFRIGQFTAAGE